MLVGITSGSQQKEHDFGERFNTAWSFLGLFAKLRDGVSPESDSGDGIESRAIVEHDREAAHAHDGIVNFDLSDGLIAMKLPELGELYIVYELLYFLAGMTSFSRMTLRL